MANYSYETVVGYKRASKVNFQPPGAVPILSINRWKGEGRLVLQDWFQRDYCWSEDQVTQLVHTLLNTPTLLPEIVLVLDGNEEDGKYYVADGHQRLKSILEKVLNNPDFVYKGADIDDSTDFYGVHPEHKDWVKFTDKLTTTSLAIKVIKNNTCNDVELNNIKSYVFGKWNNGSGMKEAEKRGGKVSDLNDMVIRPLKMKDGGVSTECQKSMMKKRVLKYNQFNDFIERLFHHYFNDGVVKDPTKKQFEDNHKMSLSDINGKVSQFIRLVKSAGDVTNSFVSKHGQFRFDATCLREMIIFTMSLYRNGDLKNITEFKNYLESFLTKVHNAYVKNKRFTANKKGIEGYNVEDHNFWYVPFVSTFGSGQDNTFKVRNKFFMDNKEVWGKLNSCDKKRVFTLEQKQYKYVEQNGKCSGLEGVPCQHTNTELSIGMLEADHIIEHSMGGTTTTDNLQMLCKDCHKEKTVKFNRKEELEMV